MTTYTGGNTTGAASTFQQTYNSDYMASNMQLVTIDRLGQDVATTEQQAFNALRKASYTAGNDKTITTDAASLSAALLADASRLDGTLIYNQKNEEFTVKRGPVFSNFILADEIN